jgi:hypothetical protein
MHRPAADRSAGLAEEVSPWSFEEDAMLAAIDEAVARDRVRRQYSGEGI